MNLPIHFAPVHLCKCLPLLASLPLSPGFPSSLVTARGQPGTAFTTSATSSEKPPFPRPPTNCTEIWTPMFPGHTLTQERALPPLPLADLFVTCLPIISTGCSRGERLCPLFWGSFLPLLALTNCLMKMIEACCAFNNWLFFLRP